MNSARDRDPRTQLALMLALALWSVVSPSKADDYSVIAASNIEWGLLNPLRGDASPRAADLWGDRTKNMATGMLVKFQKGFSSPPHIHNISYRGVVIEGRLHNDDPQAAKLWLPPGSFWTQPAGESHITAADGQENLIYLEIDSGPYLVLSEQQAFDNGERPVNVDERNLVWLDDEDLHWLMRSNVQLAYLWGDPDLENGSFVKLPAGFEGAIKHEGELKAVVVRGEANHQWRDQKAKTALSPSSFFSSSAKGLHKLTTETELVLYVSTNGRYVIE